MENHKRGGISKKVAVFLMEGPKTKIQIQVKFRGKVSMQNLTNKNYVESVYDGYVYKYRLTPKGLIKATKWSYDLKMKNDHPTQEEAKVVQAPVEATEHVTEPVEATWIDMKGKQEYVPLRDDRDWLTRHVDFLEEIVRNLTSNKNNG